MANRIRLLAMHLSQCVKTTRTAWVIRIDESSWTSRRRKCERKGVERSKSLSRRLAATCKALSRESICTGASLEVFTEQTARTEASSNSPAIVINDVFKMHLRFSLINKRQGCKRRADRESMWHTFSTENHPAKSAQQNGPNRSCLLAFEHSSGCDSMRHTLMCICLWNSVIIQSQPVWPIGVFLNQVPKGAWFRRLLNTSEYFERHQKATEVLQRRCFREDALEKISAPRLQEISGWLLFGGPSLIQIRSIRNRCDLHSPCWFSSPAQMQRAGLCYTMSVCTHHSARFDYTHITFTVCKLCPSTLGES